MPSQSNSGPTILALNPPLVITDQTTGNTLNFAFNTAFNIFNIYGGTPTYTDTATGIQIMPAANAGAGGQLVFNAYNGGTISLLSGNWTIETNEILNSNGDPVFDQNNYYYDASLNRILTGQKGAIASPVLVAPSANETALLNGINAILAALRASTGHGLIAG